MCLFPGVALIDAGESMRELAEVKDALDMEVKQNFIDPLQNLYEKDLKEIQVRRLQLLRGGSHLTPVERQRASVCSAAASPEENGGPPPGLRLQEEASGQSDRR